MKTFAWFCLTAVSLRADSVFTEWSRDGLREVGITVSDGSFTLEHLEQLARAELARTPRAAFIRLTMVGSKGGLPLPKATDAVYNFENWLKIYDDGAAIPNELAEMIAINDDAALIVRQRSGNLIERILAGGNPLRVAAGGQDFQIVKINAYGAPVVGPDRREYIEFLLRTVAPLQVETGEKLLEVLQSSFPNCRVSASVQNKGWFIDYDYPFFNPLVSSGGEPTKEEYIQTKTLECQYATGSPSCTIYDQKAR